MPDKNDAAETTIREMRWEASRGAVIISFPAAVSSDDAADLESLTAIWLRGLNRTARASSDEEMAGDWAE